MIRSLIQTQLMRFAPDSLLYKAINVGLRGLALASKLILTLYMGRYLSLADMGLYGIVFGAVMITSVVLGGRLDFVVARDIVGDTGRVALLKMRDQALFYAISYIPFTLVMVGLGFSDLTSPKILATIYALSILESLANMTSANLVALDRPLLSTFLFFIRAGLWGLGVTLIGLCVPSARHVDLIFIAWMLGAGLSLVFTLYAWRHLPWRAALKEPIDWPRLRRGVIQSFPIWLGTLGSMGALYVDRFVASYALNIEQVGIITFFGSFAAALLSLVQSGFFAFSFPRLVRHYRLKEAEAFWREVKQTGWQVSLFLFLAALCLGIFIPLLAHFLGKTAIAAEEVTLWLLLVAIWIRGNADTLYYVLYARHQDWANWVGGLLFLIPALGGNLLLIPLCGLEGVGYSSILAASFLWAWRFYYVKTGK